MKDSPTTILITGASSGIGKAIAEEYAANGRVLALTGRHKERLESVARACRDKGATVIAKIIDVTDKEAMASWIEGLDTKHPLDLVIANAGISAGTGQGNLENDGQVRAIFDINVAGVFNTLHPAIDKMVSRGHGQLALVSSLAGFRGMPGAPAYGASKAAVKSYGEALRGALCHKGIKVSVICPGFIDTPMTQVNPYHMPFLMAANKAAKRIVKGLAKNKGRITFPLPLYFAVRFLDMLPDGLAHLYTKNMPGKPISKPEE